MATEPDQPGKVSKTEKQLEQEALAALRKHRQQSGHIPWNHDDNEQLYQIDRRQRHLTQTQHALAAGLRLYQQRSANLSPYAKTPADSLPPVVETSALVSSPQDKLLEVKTDPELARIAVGLKKAGEYWVWIVARHFFGIPGWAQRDELFETLQAAGVVNTRRHFNRILKQGEGLFWGLGHDRVYLRGYVKLTKRLTELALLQAPALVATNIPGVREVYIRVGGDLGDFKAQVYAGWLAHREGPKIARETLCKLFGCTKDTLRNWEQRLEGQIEVIPNYGQTAIDPREDERIADYIPEHSYNYVTRRGEIRIRWRQPNTYNPTHIRRHVHKGQSRKARTAAAMVAWFQPVERWAAPAELSKLAFDRSHREPKRYFADVKALQRLLKRLAKLGQGGIAPQTPRYVFRGRDRNDHGIWEVSLDGEAYTSVWERLSIKAEYRWWAGYQARQKIARGVG